MEQQYWEQRQADFGPLFYCPQTGNARLSVFDRMAPFGIMAGFAGSVAQLVEQRTFNPLVASSNLARPTRIQAGCSDLAPSYFCGGVTRGLHSTCPSENHSRKYFSLLNRWLPRTWHFNAVLGGDGDQTTKISRSLTVRNHQIKASSPLRSRRLSSLSEGPLRMLVANLPLPHR